MSDLEKEKDQSNVEITSTFSKNNLRPTCCAFPCCPIDGRVVDVTGDVDEAMNMHLTLKRFPVAKTIGIIVVIWGAILCLHAAASNYPGLITLRTLLGIFESGVTPAMVIITGQWYKAEEQFLRTAIWFACNGLGTILGSSIAYGLAIRMNSYSIEAFKVLFIVIGCMTISVGVMIFFHIPDLPVVLRIKSNQQGFGNKHFKLHQLKEALLDINTWIFFFWAIAANIPNGALTNFGNILLSDTFGYSATKSMLMNMPNGAVEIVGCILFAWTVRFFRHKLAVSLFTTVITLIGMCMLAFAKQSPHARLAGYYLFSISPISMICALSCFTSNVAGHTKKITVNAIYLVGYCTGNLIGPQTFIAKQAPEYRGGQISMVVCYAVALLLNIWVYYNYWSENRRRDALLAEGKIDIPHIENIEFADLTDRENVNFRYVL
ncbi:hypothetical protein JL09_g4135 [Pichia kudriavzevii]|uniref:Allantoate permease n=1 Tax=Pichia kudriavzevii TaxID=4909 RepID=A0A099NXJ5_PICKU|nr:hypothetical protein JL09_g4135 [Pichia kudriavzevii]